jgi:hypothetical protein
MMSQNSHLHSPSEDKWHYPKMAEFQPDGKCSPTPATTSLGQSASHSTKVVPRGKKASCGIDSPIQIQKLTQQVAAIKPLAWARPDDSHSPAHEAEDHLFFATASTETNNHETEDDHMFFGTASTEISNHETEDHLFFGTASTEANNHDTEGHLFFATASTETGNHSHIPGNGHKSRQAWDTYMKPPPPSRQPIKSRSDVHVSTHQKQLGQKSGRNNQSADLLHFACARTSKSFDTIEKVALRDPSAASHRMSDTGRIALHTFPLTSKDKFHKSVERGAWIKPRYSFPLNIAIQYKADPRVLKLLVDISPQVLGDPDGPFLESSLHIAIKHHCPTESIDMMLLAMPSSAATTDRHSNTPLHAACLLRPKEQDLIQNLLNCYPKAAKEMNFHGQTPLMLLQRSNQKVSEKTLNLMQRIESESEGLYRRRRELRSKKTHEKSQSMYHS